MKNMMIRKIVWFVIAFAVAFSATVWKTPSTTRAASKKQEALKEYKKILRKSEANAAAKRSEKAAKRAFKSFLSTSEIKWAKSDLSFPASDYSFCYMALGKNRTPVLFLSTHMTDHSSGYAALYTYVKGKVKCVEVHDGIPLIYKTAGIITMYYGNGHMRPIWYYKVSGSGMVKELAYTEIFSGSEADREILGEESDTYKFNGKSVTKAKFLKLLKKQTGTTKMPDDGNLKDVVNWSKNTTANRNKYLK